MHMSSILTRASTTILLKNVQWLSQYETKAP